MVKSVIKENGLKNQHNKYKLNLYIIMGIKTPFRSKILNDTHDQ